MALAMITKAMLLKNKFLAFWQNKPTDIIKITVSEQEISLAKVKNINDDFLAEKITKNINSIVPQDIAETTAVAIASNGWQNLPLILIVPESEEIGYIFTVPPNLSLADGKAAAYWELAAKLKEQGLNIDDFLTASIKKSDNDYYIGAVRRDFVRGMVAAFNAAECELTNIIISPLGANYKEFSLLPVSNGTDYNYLRLSLAVLFLVVSILSVLTLNELYALHSINEEKLQIASELSLKNNDLKKMYLLNNIEEKTKAKEKILTELSANSVSCYSLLLHLGVTTTEGVWLDKLELANADRLHLAGRAVSYAALAEFLKNLEQDRDFFQNGAILENTESVDHGEGLTFSLSLNL